MNPLKTNFMKGFEPIQIQNNKWVLLNDTLIFNKEKGFMKRIKISIQNQIPILASDYHMPKIYKKIFFYEKRKNSWERSIIWRIKRTPWIKLHKSNLFLIKNSQEWNYWEMYLSMNSLSEGTKCIKIH